MSSEKKVLILNVLGAQYARDCLIKGSHSVPLEALENFVKEIPRSTDIVVYCARHGCSLSSQAWKLLHKLGFSTVKAYEGGIKEWHQHGLPTEGPCEMDYLRGSVEKSGKEKSEVEVVTLEELKEMLGV